MKTEKRDFFDSEKKQMENIILDLFDALQKYFICSKTSSLHRRVAMLITDLFIFIASLQNLIYFVWKNFPFLYHDLAKS